VKGQEISVSPSAPEGTGGAQVIDLMDALRASLGKSTAKKAGAAPKTEERKPPKRATAAGAPATRAKVGRR